MLRISATSSVMPPNSGPWKMLQVSATSPVTGLWSVERMPPPFRAKKHPRLSPRVLLVCRVQDLFPQTQHASTLCMYDAEMMPFFGVKIILFHHGERGEHGEEFINSWV
jgi:hypothetical protein